MPSGSVTRIVFLLKMWSIDLDVFRRGKEEEGDATATQRDFVAIWMQIDELCKVASFEYQKMS